MVVTGQDQPRVLHPVYLDVPMMVSFLAALTGGVSFEDETIRRSSSESERRTEGRAGVKLPSLVSFLGLDASIRADRGDRGAEGEEIKATRRHTAASHFNALYDALKDRKMFTPVVDAESAGTVEPGDVVEITGQFLGNPLESVLAVAGQIIPYLSLAETNPGLREAIEGPHISMDATERELGVLEDEAQALEGKLSTAQRSGNPAQKATASELTSALEEKRAEVAKATELMPIVAQVIEGQEQQKVMKMMLQMRDDLAKSAVRDTVIKGPGLTGVLTMSSEFFTDATTEYLREGVFTAIGKVTRRLVEEDRLNLFRRTVLGAAGPDAARDMIDGVVAAEALKLETIDPIIGPPALQILPLAVYV
jgi:hypothetical protein